MAANRRLMSICHFSITHAQPGQDVDQLTTRHEVGETGGILDFLVGCFEPFPSLRHAQIRHYGAVPS